MKKSILLAAFATLLLTGQVFSGCSKEAVMAPSNDTGNIVRISASGYSTARMEIVMGGTVTWINDDNVSHTVTADDGSFSSGEIPPGGKFQIGFNKTGTFAYHCDEHPSSMRASVVVVGQR